MPRQREVKKPLLPTLGASPRYNSQVGKTVQKFVIKRRQQHQDVKNIFKTLSPPFSKHQLLRSPILAAPGQKNRTPLVKASLQQREAVAAPARTQHQLKRASALQSQLDAPTVPNNRLLNPSYKIQVKDALYRSQQHGFDL